MNKLVLQLILALAIGICGAFAESAVSPDGKYIVFTKTVSGPTIGWGAGDELAAIWRMSCKGTSFCRICFVLQRQIIEQRGRTAIGIFVPGHLRSYIA